jgi:hypothetical protein
MGVSRRSATLSCLVLLGVLAAAWTAEAASPPSSPVPCEQSPCRDQLMVGSTVKTYRTPQAFDTTKAYVSVRLFSERRPLRQVSASGTDGCRRTLRGFGVEATVSTCAEIGPVRVTAARLYGAPGWLTVSCRSWRYLDAGGNASSASSMTGGAAAHR